VSKRFRTSRLVLELQTVQLSATTCICIYISVFSLVSFAAITLCFASKQVLNFLGIYFFIDSVRELFDTPSYSRCKKEILWSDRKYQTRCRVSKHNLTILGAKFQNNLQEDVCLFAVRSVKLPSVYMNGAPSWYVPVIRRSMGMVTETGIGFTFMYENNE